MENDSDDVRTEDLPDDLTPFITRTTLGPVSAGGYGDVWKCNYNHEANGISALVAVKAFRLPELCDLEKLNKKIAREIGILKILRHNNIVPLWGIATGFGHMSELHCLISPWMPNGTLNVYLASNHNNLTVLDRSRILEDISAGLRYLHSVPVMHGDITGANILIDKGGHARLIDFGLSTIVQPLLGQSHLAATSIRRGAIRYAAPELVRKGLVESGLVESDDARDLGSLEKIDIYSFGCVMLQVLSGRPPWSEINSANVDGCITIMVATNGRGPQRPDGYPAIKDSDWNFIQKCLQSEPERRSSADKVLDFVMHRFHSPDSCSRPPDDPSDDAPDDFPGASPHGGSNDSDTAEQPPDSPPLHADHELKALTTAMEKLSASTPSTPALSLPVFTAYPSIGFAGSSTAAAHGAHSLDEMFQCMWGVGHGSYCNALIRGYNLSSHLREVHGIRGPANSRTVCAWTGCNRELEKESLSRHVEEIHFGIVYECDTPHGSSGDSDTVEQTPDSPPLHHGREPNPSIMLEPQIQGFSRDPPNTNPRTALNNQLRMMYGQSASEHVHWEVYSTGPPRALTWHATVYINDMNYGHGTSRTRDRAQDMAAMQAVEHLKREGRRRLS